MQGLVSFQDRVQPEHVFGKTVHRGATLDEALAYTGLDSFNERQVPVYAEGLEVPNQKAIMIDVDGTTRVAGQHSHRYGLVRHAEAMKFVGLLTSKSDLAVDVMGYYREGSAAYASLALPESVSIAGDEVRGYLRVVSSYDGSTPLLFQAHATRMRCKNEISSMLRRKDLPRLSVKHIGDPLGRVGVASARNALQMTFDALDDFSTIADQWANEEWDAEQLDKVLTTLHPVKKDDSARVVARQENAQDAIIEALQSETNEGIRRSFWGLLQATTEVAQWKQPNKDERKRAASALSGGLVKNERNAQTIIAEVGELQLV